MFQVSQIPRKIVDLALQRDEFCIRCGRESHHTHHRMMRSQAPKDAVHRIENAVRVCTVCHSYIHANPAESYDNGWLVPSWSSPLEEPMTYADGARYYLTWRGTRIKEKN